MTRREMLERRAERRREWAQGRRTKARQCFKRGEAYRGDVAFNTQPGHIPERARVIAATDRGFEHSKMADHHEAKAAGLDAQLDRTIFTDDSDAVERLRERIAALEQEAERCVSINREYRRTPGAGPAEKLVEMVRAGSLSDKEAVEIAKDFALCPWYKAPFPPYRMANLRKRISTDKKRIEEVQRQAKVAAEAAAAPGGVLVKVVPGAFESWAVVTFSEKPSREVIEALKAAGFWWGSGSWTGPADKLPACITELQTRGNE